jgi:2-polyprenyl-3-methyl-5-hydroxy-6-metoxy-1,4-benzoquinol methylase
MASEWWSLDGKFAPLHAQNPTRVSFIREQFSVFSSFDSILTLLVLLT